MSTPAVLLIEDNPGDVGLWLEALALMGLGAEAVQVVDDGPSALLALERAAAEHRLPRLIITDSTLPGMSGADLSVVLHDHQQFKQLPVVIVTGYLPPAAASCPPWQTWFEKPADFDALSQLARTLTVRYLTAAAGATAREPHPKA